MTNLPKRRRIGLIVDHPLRDLPGMVLLAHELVCRDIEVVLIPLYDQGMDVPLLSLDALVLNFARQVNQPLAETYRKLGIALFILDTEGGVMSDAGRVSPLEIARFVRDSGFANLLDGYFFWGAALRDAFAQENVLPLDRLFLTGHPRFDFYTATFAAIDAACRTGHVLINTNFPSVNPRFSDDEASDLNALRSVGMDENYILQLCDDNQQVMAKMIELVGCLARDLPDRTFVVRPHPFERQEVYHEAFDTVPNVAVDPSGPVLDALRGAHALLHLNCSTAIEALMLEIVPLSPEWINTKFLRSHASLPSRASRSVANYETLKSLLDSPSPASGFAMAATYEDVAEAFFHYNDGEAAVRVADTLMTHCDRNSLSRANFKTSIRGSRATPRISQRLQGLAGNIFGTSHIRDLRCILQKGRDAKRFKTTDVNRILRKICRHLGTDLPIAKSARHPLSKTGLSSIEISLPTRRSA